MSKNIFANSLKMALLALPLLAGCKTSPGSIVIPPGGLTLPDCNEGQLIAVGPDKTLGCTQALTANISPPSCPTGTHALNAVDGNLLCMPKGTGSTNTDLQAAIDKVTSQTTTLKMQITNFGGGGGAAKYCGQTAGTKGAISTGNLTGVAAAAKLCQAVTGCSSTSSHMCTVYEMFESVSNGTINSNMSISKSWVYMASWQNSATAVKEKTAGLADNCGSYTYPTADKAWDGTAVRWEPTDTGKYGLKFYTGNGPNDTSATQGAQCNYTFPIACCN